MIYKNFFQRILSSFFLIFFLFLMFKKIYFFYFFIIAIFFISAYEWFLMSKNKIYLYFGLIFLLISFVSIFLLRITYENKQSLFFILLVILICVLTDIGGYIFGKIFKGPKLIKISPNKTISGMIGSFILPLSLTNVIINNNILINLINYEIQTLVNSYLLIAIISLISQSGDLIISYFKRISKINDTGNIIPGHGGILDRIDGMIFAFPFFYIFINILL